MTAAWRTERLPDLVRAMAGDGVAAEVEALMDALLPP